MLVRNPSAVISETSFRNSWHLRYCLSGTLFKRIGVEDVTLRLSHQNSKRRISCGCPACCRLLLQFVFGIWQNQEHIKSAE